MKASESTFSLMAQAENELVEKIMDEIRQRKEITDPVRRLPTDIPGDYLVQLAGELSLCLSKEAAAQYGLTLWPQIRALVESPEDLVFGSYDHARQMTETAVSKVLAETEEMPLKLAAALSRPPVEVQAADTLTSVFIMRLDAGFFLTGIHTLWPQTAPSLARILYNRCGLAAWDRVLADNKTVIGDYSPRLRRLLSSTPAKLEGNAFHILIDLAKPENDQRLTVVTAGDELEISDGVVHTWQVYAVDDFFKLFFPEEMASGAIRIMQAQSGAPIRIHHDDGAVCQVVFARATEDEVAFVMPEKVREPHLRGVYLFETVSGRIGSEEEDEETMMLRFIGRISFGALSERGVPMESGAAIRIELSDSLIESLP